MCADLLGLRVVFDRLEQEADPCLELGGRALEGRQGLVVRPRRGRWVADAPVDRLRRPGELGADLAHPVAEADHIIEAPVGQLAEVLRPVPGQVDPALAHYPHGIWMQRLRVAARACRPY